MHFQISYPLRGSDTDVDRGTLHIQVHTNLRGHTLVTDSLGAPEVERRLRGAIGPVLDAIARDVEKAVEKAAPEVTDGD